MKNQLIILLSFITMHNYTMKIEHVLPDEIVTTIVQYSLPKLNLYYDQKPEDLYQDKDYFAVAARRVYNILPKIYYLPDDMKKQYLQNNKDLYHDENCSDLATKNLHDYIATTIKLRSINRQFNTITIQNMSTSLNLNEHTVNAFLIRSTQAHIPYFIKLAIAHKADPNCIHKPDGHAPLWYAAENNHYLACKFLLEHGASAHVKRQPPCVLGYGYNPYLWPIHAAIQQHNLALVKLFIGYLANLDLSECYSLLSAAAEENNPDILAALLQARPHTNDNHWSKDDIKDALKKAKDFKGNIFQALTDEDKLKNKKCIKILQVAQKQSKKSTKSTKQRNHKK